MAHVFVSHSPVDLDPLLQVHEALRQAGIADWYPASPSDAENETLIAARIDEAFALIVLVSADSIRSRHVQRDLLLARARGVPIIPIQLDKARLGGLFKELVAPTLRIHASDPGAISALISEVQSFYHRRCPVIAVMNLKGGVGKTTVSAQVFSTWQADAGARVLLVDLDPQYNLTQVFFDMEAADERAARDCSVISLFEKSQLHASEHPSPAASWSSLSREPFNPVPRGRIAHELLGADGPDGRLDIITGQFEISKYAFATDADALNEIRQRFMGSIEALRSQYDLMVFDTNPNATFLTRCALEAADRVLAPMHPDVYSLRGVRLLNQVIRDQVAVDLRPDLSVLFNAVYRREQSAFEADARNGYHDEAAGFALSQALLSGALPRSGHLAVKEPDPEHPAWRQLVVHHGRGGGLRPIREALSGISSELQALSAAREAAGRAAA